MAKSKVRRKGSGFVIEGVLDYKNLNINVEELGEFPFDKIFKSFDGRIITIKIDEPDTEIIQVPEEE